MSAEEYFKECLDQCIGCGRFMADTVGGTFFRGTTVSEQQSDRCWRIVASNKVCYCLDGLDGGSHASGMKIGYPFIEYSDCMVETGLKPDSMTEKFFMNPDNWKDCPYYIERCVGLFNADFSKNRISETSQ